MSEIIDTKKIDNQAKLEAIRDFDLKTNPQKLTTLEFQQVTQGAKNKVSTRSLGDTAKDRESFTGPNEGFFAKFGSEEAV